MSHHKETPPEGGETVTISRDEFFDVCASAYAGYMLAQYAYLKLVKAGLLSPEDATSALRSMIETARRSSKLLPLAETRLNETMKALHSFVLKSPGAEAGPAEGRRS